MMQCDGMLHTLFHILSVVCVFFLYGDGDAFKKFIKHGRGDSQEVVEGRDIIQAELLHQLIMLHSYSPLRF